MSLAAALRRRTQFRLLLERIGAVAPAGAHVYEPNFNARVKREAETSMALVDSQPPEIRTLIHEYGIAPVQTLLDCGIRKPNTMRHVIEVCRGNSGDGRPSYGGNKPPNFKVKQ